MFIFANFTLALFILNDKKLGEHMKIKIKYCNLKVIIIIVVVISNKKIKQIIMIIKLRLPSVSPGGALVCFDFCFFFVN